MDARTQGDVVYTITGTVSGNTELERLFDNDVEVIAEQRPRFALTWAGEVWEQSEPLEFLVEGLVTKGSVNLVVGEGGCKKTWAMPDLAVCVATGASWLDFPLKQTGVLIVDEESGEHRLRRRLYETLNGHLVKKGSAIPVAFTSLNQMNLREPDDVNALHVLIEQSGAGLVIIDAMADVAAGADENSVKDMQPLFMNLRGIAGATGAAIMVIHHSNKQNGTYRGSTAIKGAVDLMLMVESQPKNKFMEFKTEKSRDVEPKEFSAVANFSLETEQFWLSACDPREKTKKLSMAQQDVLSYLLAHGNSALVDVLKSKEDDLTTAPSSRKEAYQDFVASEHIVRTDGGGRGSKAFIELTDAGRKLAEGLK